MHVVMGLRAYEAPLPHDDARRCKVLHPVAPLQLVTNTDLSLHLADCANRFNGVKHYVKIICGTAHEFPPFLTARLLLFFKFTAFFSLVIDVFSFFLIF